MSIFFKFLFISIILASNCVHCFSNGDLCIRNKKECVLNSTSSIKCLNDECQRYKKLNFTCDQKYCTTDESACENAKLITKYLKSYYNKLTDINYFIKFSVFENSIQKCSTEYLEWKATDFCYNKKSCTVKRIVSMRSWTVKLFEKKPCPCKEKLNVSCPLSQLCAINENACTVLGFNSFNKMKGIKACF